MEISWLELLMTNGHRLSLGTFPLMHLDVLISPYQGSTMSHSIFKSSWRIRGVRICHSFQLWKWLWCATGLHFHNRISTYIEVYKNVRRSDNLFAYHQSSSIWDKSLSIQSTMKLQHIVLNTVLLGLATVNAAPTGDVAESTIEARGEGCSMFVPNDPDYCNFHVRSSTLPPDTRQNKPHFLTEVDSLILSQRYLVHLRSTQSLWWSPDNNQA